MRTDPAAEFAGSLRTLHITCGKPSYARICELATRYGRSLAPSTISEVLNAKRLPKVEFVLTFVRALLHHRDGADLAGKHDVEARKWRQNWQQAVLGARVQSGQEPQTGRCAACGRELSSC